VGSGFANSLNRPAGPERYWDELDKFWNGLDQESETAGDCEYAHAGLSSPVFERERNVPRAIWNGSVSLSLTTRVPRLAESHGADCLAIVVHLAKIIICYCF
jgi:hypothetical protein